MTVAAVFSTKGAAVLALLLAAMLLPGCARADDVTVELCKTRFWWYRIRSYPADNDATLLNMYRCNITELNPNDVANLQKVEEICLSENAMTRIDLDVFRSAPELKTLKLIENKLRELSAFGERSCPSLTLLALRQNLLTTIHPSTFSACSKLQHLELSLNHITHIHQDTFIKLTNLQNLFLFDNNIKFVTEDMFASNKKLVQLDFFDNSLTSLPLDFTVNLKQVGVKLVYFFFDNKSWPCACLLEALADAKKAGVDNYNKSPSSAYYSKNPSSTITRFQGNLRECVYSGAVPCPRGLRPACGGR